MCSVPSPLFHPTNPQESAFFRSYKTEDNFAFTRQKEDAYMEIQELRKSPHLSASGINDYLDCGLLYKFGRIDRLPPEFISDAMVFGSSIHRTLEDFHSEKLIGNRLTLRDMQERFEKHWKASAEGNDQIRYSKQKDYETLLREGKDLLAVYWDQWPGDRDSLRRQDRQELLVSDRVSDDLRYFVQDDSDVRILDLCLQSAPQWSWAHVSLGRPSQGTAQTGPEHRAQL